MPGNPGARGPFGVTNISIPAIKIPSKTLSRLHQKKLNLQRARLAQVWYLTWRELIWSVFFASGDQMKATRFTCASTFKFWGSHWAGVIFALYFWANKTKPRIWFPCTLQVQWNKEKVVKNLSFQLLERGISGTITCTLLLSLGTKGSAVGLALWASRAPSSGTCGWCPRPVIREDPCGPVPGSARDDVHCFHGLKVESALRGRPLAGLHFIARFGEASVVPRP